MSVTGIEMALMNLKGPLNANTSSESAEYKNHIKNFIQISNTLYFQGSSADNPINKALKKFNDEMIIEVLTRFGLQSKPQFSEEEARSKLGEEIVKKWMSNEALEITLKESPDSTVFKPGDPNLKGILKVVIANHKIRCNYISETTINEHPKYYLSGVSRQVFLNNIQEGHFWKDVGASAAHGEFTHSIQWYLLERCEIFDPKTLGQLYRTLGKVDLGLPNSNKGGLWGLWDCLCDRLARGSNGFRNEGPKDFRCPENLNAYILGGQLFDEEGIFGIGKSKIEWPLMQYYLNKRYKKMVASHQGGMKFLSKPEIYTDYKKDKKQNLVEVKGMKGVYIIEK